jgi:hypothetical protein
MSLPTNIEAELGCENFPIGSKISLCKAGVIQSYIPNSLWILYYTSLLAYGIVYIYFFTYSVKTNWKGLKGRLVERQTNNLTY